MSRIFKCDHCGAECETNEEDTTRAEEELKQNFNVPKEECAKVCDDCYDMIMAKIAHTRN